MIKHVAIVLIGISIMYAVHRIPLNILVVCLSSRYLLFGILIYTALQGNLIEGATQVAGLKSHSWLIFSNVNSASVVLMVYVARYLSVNKEININFWRSLVVLWLPVMLIIATILPANLSTAALIGILVFVLAFIGGYPKNIYC
ncbi:MAG: hypothetical protein CM15mP59_2060 [Flavobacteriaceae bacterium]|nr:MAG: hypothetical protein CM15mP59_2060 [Flavobacteriaceae bacterium]